MKKLSCVLIIILVCACLPVSFALTVYDDGFITEGEYGYFVQWTSYDPPLIVEGGGADWIEMRDYGRLEVRYTSTPLSNTAGILDIVLDGNSRLLYQDGETGEIFIYDDSLATLKGGRIDYISSYQFASTKHIDLYCQPGWSWFYESSKIAGITGLWESGIAFNIDFIDKTYLGYDPVWMNINIIEIPEPATLLLFGLGLLMAEKRRR